MLLADREGTTTSLRLHSVADGLGSGSGCLSRSVTLLLPARLRRRASQTTRLLVRTPVRRPDRTTVCLQTC